MTERLQQQLGYHFSNLEFLHQALTHRSCLQNGQDRQNSAPPPSQKEQALSSENTTCSQDGLHCTEQHNERLEFLGDAVLGLAVSDLLFHRYPEQPEGTLSHWRSTLVNTQSLSQIGHKYNLGSFLIMGRGEVLSGGRDKRSLLANAMEALLGAIYLDSGYRAAYKVVQRIFATSLEEFQPGKWAKDYKSMLQEQLQSKGLALPEYQVVTVSGAPHKRTFHIACIVGKEKPDQFPLSHPISCIGIGRSKRIAEQSAAKEVLAVLDDKQDLQRTHLSFQEMGKHDESTEQYGSSKGLRVGLGT